MKAILFCIFIAGHINVEAQESDYAKIRPSIIALTCGTKDVSMIDTSITQLLALDTNTIEKNLSVYYEDLGQLYWLKAVRLPNDSNLVKSIAFTQKALYHNPKSTKAYWNLACAHIFNGDCEQGQQCLEKYNQYIKPKYRDEEEQKQLLALCVD